VVLTSGQKVQFHNTVALSLWRPNRLRGDLVGDSLQQEFYYDGKTITLYDLTTKYYASMAAPATLEQMMD
jgi:hypothetical protein